MPGTSAQVIDLRSDDDEDVPAPLRQTFNIHRAEAHRRHVSDARPKKRSVPPEAARPSQPPESSLPSTSRQHITPSKAKVSATTATKPSSATSSRPERPECKSSAPAGLMHVSELGRNEPEGRDRPRNWQDHANQRDSPAEYVRQSSKKSNPVQSSKIGSTSVTSPARSQEPPMPIVSQAPAESRSSSSSQGQKRPREDGDFSSALQKKSRSSLHSSFSFGPCSEHKKRAFSSLAATSASFQSGQVIDLTKSPEPEPANDSESTSSRVVSRRVAEHHLSRDRNARGSSPRSTSSKTRLLNPVKLPDQFQSPIRHMSPAKASPRPRQAAQSTYSSPSNVATGSAIADGAHRKVMPGVRPMDAEQSRRTEIPETPPLSPILERSSEKTWREVSRSKHVSPSDKHSPIQAVERSHANKPFGDDFSSEISQDTKSTESQEDTTYGSLSSSAQRETLGAPNGFRRASPPVNQASVPTNHHRGADAAINKTLASPPLLAGRLELVSDKFTAVQIVSSSHRHTCRSAVEADLQTGTNIATSNRLDTQSALQQKPDTNAANPQNQSPSLRKDKEHSHMHDASSDGMQAKKVHSRNETMLSTRDNGVSVPFTSFAPRTAMSAFADMDTAEHVELVVGQHLEEMRKDNEYWTRIELRRARSSAHRPQPSIKNMRSTSVFKALTPIELHVVTEKSPVQFNTAKIYVEQFNGASSKVSKLSYALECDMFETDASDVPPYSHYVSIGSSFLAHNEMCLQHWPYFGDDFNLENAKGLKRQYYLDVYFRERKLLRLGQSENFAPYAEDMLKQIGCDWPDLLRFLLDPHPDIGSSSADARKALQNRSKCCNEDFARESDRWITVLSTLPVSEPENIARAALLCDQFQRIASFPLWHIVTMCDFTRNLLRHIHNKAAEYDLTCRVCMRFNCPYHGELRESVVGTYEEDEDEVETDIVNPKERNFRLRVGLPHAVEMQASAATKCLDRRNLEYWSRAQWSNLKWYPTERTPFYPCHHPGMSCESAQCTCFVEKVPCEKSCTCPSSCPRKFQGCSCSLHKSRKGHKLVCFDDDRCICFQRGRECDPDLCGSCGVSDVLDPLHKHNELPGRCRNANIQRGVAKHTIIGDSGVHGLGLYACEDIRAHEFVGEYKGEIINKEEAERRGAVYEHQKLSYLFTLNDSQEIDSTYFGNKIRFINHADKSKCNLYPRIIMVNTVFRIALYGQKRIRPGEELFFDYGPMFPNEQLGGKSTKKAAPRVRNSNLVLQEFWDVQEVEDRHGNIRARKMASDSSEDDGGSSNDDVEAAPRDGYRSAVAKKSITTNKKKGAARSIGASGPQKPPRLEDAQEETADDVVRVDPSASGGGREGHGGPGQRLMEYSVLGGDLLPLDTASDEDFEPEDTASEASNDDISSVT